MLPKRTTGASYGGEGEGEGRDSNKRGKKVVSKLHDNE
jgi:hypothetical protein